MVTSSTRVLSETCTALLGEVTKAIAVPAGDNYPCQQLVPGLANQLAKTL